MRRIIIPTDFSENSIVGIHYAIELFGVKDVKYFLVNSVEPPKGRATVFMSLVERLDKQSQEQLIRIRKKVLDDLKLSDLDMECITVHGDIMSNMEDLVQELEATSIFMGTKGRGNVAEKFIGSNTFRVLKNTQSPIFIIPRNIEIKKPSRIGLATDLEEISAELVARIVRFTKSQNARLEIINMRMDGNPCGEGINSPKSRKLYR